MAAQEDRSDTVQALHIQHGQRLYRLGNAARAAAQAAEDAREARDDAIEHADQAGYSNRWIATKTGLSPSAVHDIVIRRTAARQAALARTAGL